MKYLAILPLAILLACTDNPAPQAAPQPAPKSEFKNLQVLPPDIPREELLATMRGFTRGLGVRCDHCHTPLPGDPEKFDFPSDANPHKNIARTMLRMTMRINGDFISKLPREAGATEAPPRVVCWTCHRGKTEPEAPPPPPANR
jgi:hypothetical protein